MCCILSVRVVLNFNHVRIPVIFAIKEIQHLAVCGDYYVIFTCYLIYILWEHDLSHPCAYLAQEEISGLYRKRLFAKAEERYLTIGNVTTLDMLSDNEKVIAMSLDSNDCLWLATSMGRTFFSDRDMKKFKPSPVDSLLNDGLIEDILSTPNSVWLMNVKKVVCFDLRRQTATVYQTTEDLVNILSFRHRAICQDGDGVLAGGYGGFTHLPELRKNKTVPVVPPVLTDVLVDGKSIFFSGNGASESSFSHVVLPSDAHNIELRLSQLAYYAGTQQRLQYRLKGLEDRWSELESAYPHVEISSLPCGTFKLEVRIAQSDGRWSEPLFVTKVKRLPAWYETALAHILYLLLALAALAGTTWFILRRHRRKVETEVLQAKVSAITADHHLTDKMIAIIDHHLDDSDFGLEQLLAEIGMSKSTLYRQLKTETDMTPSDFIRNIRLKRACEMLLSQKMTVAEVAYATGFSNPKYFTRCFKDMFGKTPTEYIRSQQKSNGELDGQGAKMSQNRGQIVS
jgi:AraC-like DNA-binding protein